MEIIGTIADMAGVIGAIAAIFAWLAARRTCDELLAERLRLQRPIIVELVLESEDDRRVLDIGLRRAELTRAELLGRLGMLPMREAGKRFSLAYLAKRDFLAQLSRAQDDHGAASIRIPCTAAEFEQFA